MEKALALENYDPIEFPDKEKEICGVIKDGKDTQTKSFVNKPPNDRWINHKGTLNVISSNSGVTKAERNAATAPEYLKLFVML